VCSEVKRQYDQLKLQCDESEVDGLPNDFSKLWTVVRESRVHKVKIDNTSKEIEGINNWESLAGIVLHPVDRILNPSKTKGLFALYKICKANEEGFAKKCHDISSQMRCKKLVVGNLKGQVRAMYKFIYKYNCNARRLTDVLRASFIFEDLETLREGAEVIHRLSIEWTQSLEFLANCRGTQRVKGGILNVKDRIASPPASGYRDVLLNVEFGDVIVEIQLHLAPFLALKKSMHKTYKVARHFGTMFDQLCFRE